MSTEQTIIAPSLGEQGETCTACAGVLAPDQRYCLNCGRRRTDTRVPYAEVLQNDAETAPVHPSRVVSDSGALIPGGWSPVAIMVGVAAIALVLGVGVLIGRGVSSSPRRASAPQVISVGGAPAASQSAQTGGAAFTADWPAGKDGYTVALQSLSKDQTQPTAVAAAKTAATAKGAPTVGALDSDTYPSLEAGQYVVYSGIYKAQAEATKALKALKSKFPQAKVIHVSKKGSAAGGSTGPAKTISRDELKKLNSTSGSDYFKKSQKLPKKIAIPGPPPAKDNKPAGGGSGGGETIG